MPIKPCPIEPKGVVAELPPRPSASASPVKSVDSPESVAAVDAAETGVARLCSAWEISPDSDDCAFPAAVPVAWAAAALCTADPAGLVVCGASANGVTWLAAAEFAA